MSFTRKVLIPGLAALFLSQVIMSVSWHMLAPLNGSPAAWQFEWPGIVSSYPAWLVMLPLAGGLGAWLARRAGASLRQRLTAALFPAFYAPVALVSLVIRVLFFAPERAAEPLSLSTFLLAWVLAPAVACVLGALPLLWGAPRTAQAPPTHAASA